MAVNVAELVATISLRVNGADQASRNLSAAQAEIQRSLQVIEQTAGSTSASMNKLRSDVADTAAALQAAVNAPAALTAEMNRLGVGANEMGSVVENSATRVRSLERALQASAAKTAEARKEYAAVANLQLKDRTIIEARAKALQDAERRQAMLTEKLVLYKKQLADATRLQQLFNRVQSGQSARDVLNLTARLEQQNNRLAGSLQGVGKQAKQTASMFRLTHEQVGSAAVMAARGQLSFAGLQAVVGRVLLGVPQLMIAFVALAAVLAPLIAGIKILSGSLARLGQDLDRRSITAPMTADLEALRGELNMTTVAIQDFYEKARNVASSQGIVDSRQFAESQLAAAGNLRFLASDQDPTRAIEAVRSAVAGSTGALAEYGLNVGEINRQLANLPPDADAATRSITILNAVNAQLAQRQGEIAANNARSSTSFQDLATTMGKIKEVFAQALIPVVADFIKWLEDMLKRGAPAIAAVGVAIKVLAVGTVESIKTMVTIGEAFVGMWQRAGSAITTAIKSFLPPIGVLIDILKFFAPDEALEGISREFEQMQRSIRGIADEMGGAVPDLRNFTGEVERVGMTLDEMRSKISGGFSVVDTVKQFGDALNAIDDEGLNGRTAFNLARAIDTQFNAALDGGLERLSLLGQELSRLRSEGFISTEEFDAVNRILRDSQESMRPFAEAAENVRSQVAGVGEVGNTAVSQVQAVGSALDALNGKRVTTYIDVITNGAFGQFTLGGAGGGGTGATYGGTGAAGGRRGRGAPNLGPTGPASDGSSISNENRRFAAIARAADDMRGAAQDVANALAGPGGGGGGGGAIGDIRAFFREMNRLIKIGVNDGVAFSTAGNTIPLGGTAEFLNRSGGTLIETINIRGIWDFTDPGQKKEIIRELEEALRNLKRGQN